MAGLILVTFSIYTLYSIVLWQQCLILDFWQWRSFVEVLLYPPSYSRIIKCESRKERKRIISQKFFWLPLFARKRAISAPKRHFFLNQTIFVSKNQRKIKKKLKNQDLKNVEKTSPASQTWSEKRLRGLVYRADENIRVRIFIVT